MPRRCQPIEFARREKNLGVLTSAVSGATAYVLMYLFGLYGVPVSNASALMSVITNALGYVLDVLFAKKCYSDFGSGRSYLLERMDQKLAWLLQSLMSFGFVRFLITVAIDIMVSRFMLRYAQSVLDSAGILTSWRWRDSLLALFITFVNFNLFVNRIRFDWAYSIRPDPALDLIMFSWFSSLVVSLTIFDTVEAISKDSALPKPFNMKN